MNESHKNTATYIKLQDAYVSERNQLGTWSEVGYVAPGASKAGTTGTTTNFEYMEGTGTTSLTANSNRLGTFWGAANIVALNDCDIQQKGTAAASAHWYIDISNTSTGNSVSYATVIHASDKTDCEQLTPSFASIGR